MPCVFALSACYGGLGSARNAFDESNAMLVLSSPSKFSAEDTALYAQGFLFHANM